MMTDGPRIAQESVTQQAQALNDSLELHSIGGLHIQVDDRLRAMRCDRQAAARTGIDYFRWRGPRPEGRSGP
jgi:hypothetical protein